MLEELIEEYLKAKKKYKKAQQDPNGLIAESANEYNIAADKLLSYIMRHSGDLVAWERQHALRTSPFEDPK